MICLGCAINWAGSADAIPRARAKETGNRQVNNINRVNFPAMDSRGNRGNPVSSKAANRVAARMAKEIRRLASKVANRADSQRAKAVSRVERKAEPRARLEIALPVARSRVAVAPIATA